jgi:hypothetical protein
MRHKPTFILNQTSDDTGIKVVHDYFVVKHGYTPEFLRTLVVKYPFILSRTKDDIEFTFKTLEENGIERAEAVKLVFDCPKILSIDLKK